MNSYMNMLYGMHLPLHIVISTPVELKLCWRLGMNEYSYPAICGKVITYQYPNFMAGLVNLC